MKAIVDRNQISISLMWLWSVIVSFREWWMDEFRALFPSQIGQWIFGAQRVLVIQQIGDAVKLSLVDQIGGLQAEIQTPAENYSSAMRDNFLKDHKLGIQYVSVTVRLPSKSFFCRKLSLPVQTLQNLDAIVAQDLERKTPFRLDGVYHYHVVERQGDQKKILVTQWVIKRDVVAGALSYLHTDISDVDFIEADDPDKQLPSPIIALKSGGRRRSTWYLGVIRALLVSSIVLGLTIGGVKFWLQQSIIDELDSKISQTRGKAQQVRAKLDGLEKKQAVAILVREQKILAPGLLDIWEQTTTLLPQNSWLTELQLSSTESNKERKVSWVGFSEAAASLVGLFAQSQIFKETSLTSPITTDSIEGRERFSMQAKVIAADRRKSDK